MKPDHQTILSILKKTYPKAECALDYGTPWQLLIATILSAQCTDERVNMTTPILFKKYPTVQSLAKARVADVEKIVKSTGFYRQKALSIVSASRVIVEKYGGEVPKTMEQLLELRGVARKTANVVLGTGYGIPSGVVVDTHVRRLSGRLGFTRETDPVKIERDLIKILPKGDWIWFSHALITHGRRICKAGKPLCPECPLIHDCPYPKKTSLVESARSARQVKTAVRP
jgi:endonuclease III